jgi:hypothetical protein
MRGLMGMREWRSWRRPSGRRIWRWVGSGSEYRERESVCVEVWRFCGEMMRSKKLGRGVDMIGE